MISSECLVDEERFCISLFPNFGFSMQISFITSKEWETRQTIAIPGDVLFEDNKIKDRFTINALMKTLTRFGVKYWGLHHLGVGLLTTVETRPAIEALLTFLQQATNTWSSGAGLYQFVAERAGENKWFFLVSSVDNFPAFEFLCDSDGLVHVQIDVHVRESVDVVRKSLKLEEGFAMLPPLRHQLNLSIL